MTSPTGAKLEALRLRCDRSTCPEDAAVQLVVRHEGTAGMWRLIGRFCQAHGDEALGDAQAKLAPPKKRALATTR